MSIIGGLLGGDGGCSGGSGTTKGPGDTSGGNGGSSATATMRGGTDGGYYSASNSSSTVNATASMDQNSRPSSQSDAPARNGAAEQARDNSAQSDRTART
jgi:hypothetical protein